MGLRGGLNSGDRSRSSGRSSGFSHNEAAAQRASNRAGMSGSAGASTGWGGGLGPNSGWGSAGRPSRGAGIGGGYGWGGSAGAGSNRGSSTTSVGVSANKAANANKSLTPSVQKAISTLDKMNLSGVAKDYGQGIATAADRKAGIREATSRFNRGGYKDPEARARDAITSYMGPYGPTAEVATQAFNEGVDTGFGTAIRDSLASAFGSPNVRSVTTDQFTDLANKGVAQNALSDFSSGLLRSVDGKLAADTTGEMLDTFGSIAAPFALMAASSALPVGGVIGKLATDAVGTMAGRSMVPSPVSLGTVGDLINGDYEQAALSALGPLGDIYSGAIAAQDRRNMYGLPSLPNTRNTIDVTRDNGGVFGNNNPWWAVTS